VHALLPLVVCSFVTGTFGLMAAGVVVGMLAAPPPPVEEAADAAACGDGDAAAAAGSEWRWTRHALRDLNRPPRGSGAGSGGDSGGGAAAPSVIEPWREVLGEAW
jgi:hypothetical protein